MDPKINIHLGDCMEAMKGMPDNAYDLAIVDPEYGIGQDGRIDRPHEAIQKTAQK